MKNIIIAIVIVLSAFISAVMAQNNQICRDDYKRIEKQINDSLPDKWLIKTDTSKNEIIIQSTVIDLMGAFGSNDPLVELKGHCDIYILITSRISPDSINVIRKRNKELKNSLPPQYSKDSLRNWYNQNAQTLKILDSEPTHYDNNYSYRIKCSRLPKNKNDITEYEDIMAYINRILKKYQD